jgi:hypothetical protein
VAQNASYFEHRTYEVLIQFIPETQVSKSGEKLREIKVMLFSNPVDPMSEKLEKRFIELTDLSCKAYCRWRCNIEEFATGTANATVQGKMNIAVSLLGQAHKENWTNIVAMANPTNATPITASIYQAIMEQFLLTFMTAKARRLQKRYMTSNVIQKPKSWSSRMAAARLSTLSRYLQYLYGTAGNFTQEELKDMLVQLHPTVYKQFLRQANYDVDTHTSQDLTAYLQNLALIETQFRNDNANKNKGSHQDKTVRKAGKSFKKRDPKLCRKHPHGTHTWDDCNDNPKNKDKKMPFKNKILPPKQAAEKNKKYA